MGFLRASLTRELADFSELRASFAEIPNKIITIATFT